MEVKVWRPHTTPKTQVLDLNAGDPCPTCGAPLDAQEDKQGRFLLCHNAACELRLRELKGQA